MDWVNTLAFNGMGFRPYWMMIMLVKWLKPSFCAWKKKGKMGKVIFQTSCMDYGFRSTCIKSKVIRYNYGAHHYISMHIKNPEKGVEMKKLWLFKVGVKLGQNPSSQNDKIMAQHESPH